MCPPVLPLSFIRVMASLAVSLVTGSTTSRERAQARRAVCAPWGSASTIVAALVITLTSRLLATASLAVMARSPRR